MENYEFRTRTTYIIILVIWCQVHFSGPSHTRYNVIIYACSHDIIIIIFIISRINIIIFYNQWYGITKY